MNIIRTFSVAVAIVGVTTVAEAANPPAPDLGVYGSGPMLPNVNVTNLSAQERVAYALMEGVMQAAEAMVHAHGCAAANSPISLPLSVYSDSSLTTFPGPVDKYTGQAKLGVSPNQLVLDAVAEPSGFRGQAITVTQPLAPAGFINGKSTTGFASSMTYNSANNMMVGSMSVSVMSINGVPNTFSGYVIKDFYMGSGSSAEPPGGGDDAGGIAGPPDATYLVFDWGLQSLSKDTYPVEKYWQRSKVRRSDGGLGMTAFVKDRLVGITKCRITIATDGTNTPGLFSQGGVFGNGKLTISRDVAPSVVPAELTVILSP